MPQNLIEAIVDANRTRKDFVADEVLQMVWDRVYAGKEKPVVGVYLSLIHIWARRNVTPVE